MVQQKPEFDPCSPVHVKKGLRLLATTDLHMHLTGYDYRTNRPSHATGLTRIATLIREARAQAETEGRSVLLFDNGDTFQGTPLGDPEVLPENAPHPLIRAFDFLGYDAMGLGNHDFDFGLAPLDRALADASCPVISSNLERCDPGAEPPTVPFAILDRILVTANGPKGIRIGVLSFLPPQTTKWDAHILSGRVRVHDIVTTARNRVAELKRLGCDLIVALGHTGIEEASNPETAENVGVALAGIAGIDALIAGHTHLVLPGKAHEGISHVDAEKGLIHGTPVIMPGANGSHLGVIDLELDWSPTQGWRVTGTTSESRPVALPDAQATVPEDPDLLNL